MHQDYLPTVATVPFTLGRPEDLPASVAQLSGVGTVAASVLTVIRPSSARSSTDLLLTAWAVAADRIGSPPGAPVTGDPAESGANRANDLAFGIQRVTGEPSALLVQATVAAVRGVLELAATQGTVLDAPAWQDLLSGAECLLAWLAAPRQAPRPMPVPHPGPARPARPSDGLRHWVRGHHVFMVLCQGAAMALRCVTTSTARHETDDAAAAAGAAIALMRASRAALLYAGSADPESYQQEIRPTLMPPIAPPKMSGLHWRDHEALVSALTSVGPAWRTLKDQRPELVTTFADCLDEVYRAHVGVCASFVGELSPSLLATRGSSRSAVGVLDQFRRKRLETVIGSRSAAEPARSSQQKEQE